METTEKIDVLFKIFTGRFGSYELKDGQDLAFIKRSWEKTFGKYELEDLKVAATICMGEAKWDKWPNPGDFKTALDKFSASVDVLGMRDKYANKSKEWKKDRSSFVIWYGSIALHYPEHLVSRDEVFYYFAGDFKGDFMEQAVEAWKQGIFEKWDRLVKDCGARFKRGIEAHIDLKRMTNEKFANTTSMDLIEKEAYIAALRAQP